MTDNIKVFSLEGLKINGLVCSVYDGDTITCIFSFPGTDIKYKWKCRLDRIDTPEIKTKDDLEKLNGIKVRDILRSKILNKDVELLCGKMDKYGRVLVDILYEGVNINDWLIENNYANKYDGGTKTLWDFKDPTSVDGGEALDK